MTSTQQDQQGAGVEERATDFDAVIVGAGFSGLYMLHRLRNEMGLSARVYEEGSGVGGTWYWNRYPGARSDSDSYIYSYSFSEELWQEWEWSERYPEQSEIRSYLEHVADRFDLRRDIQLSTRVTGATFDEEKKVWEIRTDSGDVVTARFFIAAVGALSSATRPDIPGRDAFEGEWYHTGHWPHEGVDFTGKTVGIIGTGATGIQAIPLIAGQADHLTVFQRTANYAIPARNGPVDPEVKEARKEDFEGIWDRVRNSFAGHELWFIEKSALEDSPEEREREYRARWDRGGFGLWVGNYQDIFDNKESNDTVSEWMRERIAERVHDPETAEKLTPRDHAFGTKRVPLESNYYEAFNRDNVGLVDLKAAPIQEITPKGLRTSEAEYEFDVLIFATGFDAMTGPLNRIDIRGRGGKLMREKWAEGPKTYLGLTSAGFPNLFFITGPGSPSVLTNMPVSIEQHVEFVSKIIGDMREHGAEIIEPTPQAEREWSDHVQELAHATLFPESATWYMGANIPGKPRVFMPYLGGAGPYREKCDEIAANGYEGFAIDGAASREGANV
ncbi:MAG: NAD(P)/FAD-dependent oxidoreductase [Actinomycetota bacterium]|nr:NAD(P)/FAD-dependent oxidoreductase [Actinomycetota bacterium]